MAVLVANLLQFSRLSSQRTSSVDVGEDLVKTLELVHHYFRGRGVEVVQELAPGVPVIQADRQLLRQVFLNLLTNAGDAMPDGGTLSLRVAAGSLEGGRPAVVIEFADTGVGIPPEDLGSVKGKFFKGSNAVRGSGIGLALVDSIMNALDGTLDLRSTLGKGTVVTLGLPLYKKL